MLSENLIKGQIIELKVQEELLRYGFDVSVPSYNSSKYDLIVDTGQELLKIQVKKAIGKSDNSFSFCCTTQNVKSSTQSKHKYTNDEIDYFATVWKDKVYLIPVDETSNVKTLRCDEKYGFENCEIYLAENIFKSFRRLSDDELYNQSITGQEKNYCIDCGCEISKQSLRCVGCSNKRLKKVERPNRQTLKELIQRLPFSQIALIYGVTDNAVRRWCDSENLPRKKSEIKKITQEEWVNI